MSILARIADGDESAIRECIVSYGALVWGLARRLSRTPSDAEDAAQEIFFQVWRHAGRFDCALGSETTFIATLARRRLIDRLRRAAVEPPIDFTVSSHDSTALSQTDDDTAEFSGDSDRALLALAQLRPAHRQVLELGLLQGLTHLEIANRLALPLGTVKSFMRRGLMSVRERLNIAISPPPRRRCAVSRARSAKIDLIHGRQGSSSFANDSATEVSL